AEDHRVLISCQPHNPGVPPAGFRGVARVLVTVEGLRRLVSIRESPYHGLNFCFGSVAEMLQEPAQEIHDVLREFGRRGKLFNIHFRNIKGKKLSFVETFPDEGDMDMWAILKLLAEIDYKYMVMPDHVPHLSGTTPNADGTHPQHVATTPNDAIAFAYCFGYIRAQLQILAEQYMVASEKVARRAMLQPEALLPCAPVAGEERACAGKFVTTFGRRAYRRPLESDEVSRLLAVYDWGFTEVGFSRGIELVIQAMLQSPHFLYRVEFGMPNLIEKDIIALTPHEVASRLSYMLWSSMPDAELFAAADAGRLGTAQEIETQARRMLEDPRARQAVANFNAQWLGLSHMESMKKDPATYPKYDESLRPLWREETMAFLDDVIFDGQGDVATLFTATHSVMNAQLATFYGIEGGPTTEAFVRVELDPARTAGVLTQGSVLAVTGKPNQSSPVHRGKFVRERLLCQTIPPPPNNVVATPPDLAPDLTTRERYSEHSENPSCAGCHIKMDPIGFGFEHYDGIGLWRDAENGLPVDDTGEILDTRNIDGPFDGVVDLGRKLAESEEARQCVATQWFRYGYGRAEGADDYCTMKDLQETFAAKKFNIKELLVALTQTDSFRYRRAITVQGP
ncbi:MAG TPA: DUF1592 domain-containing protein, partial [Polyangium sp.]|nr:DUF1592 domain-containing protein [Polyangium sp.]